MPLVDYFFPAIAMNDATGQPVPDAEADVFAFADAGFTTPLPITDVQGVPMAKLKASPTGIFPAFRCAGQTQVVAKSGDLTTPITSRYGGILEVIPDPSAAPDGRTPVTSAGAYTLVPLPGAGIGIRDENSFTTAVLAADARELGLVTLGKTILVLRVEVDSYARVRLYDTTAHRDADATRAIGVDPDPLTNTGVLMDMELEPGEAWTLTPPAPVGSFTGTTSVPVTVDNLDAVSAAVGVTFTFVILEG